MDAPKALELIQTRNPKVIQEINEFTRETFTTRGGRLGSGMGLLLEGLWAYHMTTQLKDDAIEIGWIADDQYNDYACISKTGLWDPSTGSGEFFRIEAKTMNLGADESKAHFAELVSGISAFDQLLVLLWRWTPDVSGLRVWPKVEQVFLGNALDIAQLRDKLHIARGGTFVDPARCPDSCNGSSCPHAGEPLNANGKRERLSGPEVTRPSRTSAFAANFGGLVRMLGTSNISSRQLLEHICSENGVADEYVKFINRHVKNKADTQ